MKSIISTIIAVGCTVTASAFVSAATIQPIETTPILARDCEAGKTILLEITIQNDGSVQDVRSLDPEPYNAALAARVERSVANWKFSPVNGISNQNASRTIRMPVHITDVSKS